MFKFKFEPRSVYHQNFQTAMSWNKETEVNVSSKR